MEAGSVVGIPEMTREREGAGTLAELRPRWIFLEIKIS